MKEVKKISIQKKHSYEWQCSFWRGHHFVCGKEYVAVVRPYLENPADSDDQLSVEEYMQASKMSLAGLIAQAYEYFSKASYGHYGKQQDAVEIKGAPAKLLGACLQSFHSNAGVFRGFPENGRIVFAGGAELLAPQHFTGYVPSVQTSRVSYPNAVYRDGDLGDILVSSGAPVVESGWTAEEKAYPGSFAKVRSFRPKQHELWLAVTYSLRKAKPEPVRYIGCGFGPL